MLSGKFEFLGACHPLEICGTGVALAGAQAVVGAQGDNFRLM